MGLHKIVVGAGETKKKVECEGEVSVRSVLGVAKPEDLSGDHMGILGVAEAVKDLLGILEAEEYLLGTAAPLLVDPDKLKAAAPRRSQEGEPQRENACHHRS